MSLSSYHIKARSIFNVLELDSTGQWPGVARVIPLLCQVQRRELLRHHESAPLVHSRQSHQR